VTVEDTHVAAATAVLTARRGDATYTVPLERTATGFEADAPALEAGEYDVVIHAVDAVGQTSELKMDEPILVTQAEAIESTGVPGAEKGVPMLPLAGLLACVAAAAMLLAARRRRA
jgi:hypothetical protein